MVYKNFKIRDKIVPIGKDGTFYLNDYGSIYGTLTDIRGKTLEISTFNNKVIKLNIPVCLIEDFL